MGEIEKLLDLPAPYALAFLQITKSNRVKLKIAGLLTAWSVQAHVL